MNWPSGLAERLTSLVGSRSLTPFARENAITSFASLSFILVFGLMSYLAFRQRGHDEVNGLVPAVGTVVAMAFFPLMLDNLSTREPNTFYMVVGIAIVVIAVELLYFEQDIIAEEVKEFEPDPGGIDWSN